MSGSYLIIGQSDRNPSDVEFIVALVIGVVIILACAILPVIVLTSTSSPEVKLIEEGDQLRVHIIQVGDYVDWSLKKLVGEKLDGWLKDHPGAALEMTREQRIGEGQVVCYYSINWGSEQ